MQRVWEEQEEGLGARYSALLPSRPLLLTTLWSSFEIIAPLDAKRLPLALKCTSHLALDIYLPWHYLHPMLLDAERLCVAVPIA